VAAARETGETISDDGREDARAPARVVRLRVIASPALGDVVVTLTREALVIGRDPEGDRRLALPEEHASRSHAVVTFDPAQDAWSIRDLDSRNGVFVDGARVTSAPLRHGSLIRIGRSLLVCSDDLLAQDDLLAPETPALRGASVTMHRLRGEIARVAPTQLPVLVLGETGTGKESIACELHRLSGRSGQFVAFNCAAIPEQLAESTLFGHAAGAFTGATTRVEGLFEAADGGTIFLDEVGELSPSLQAKLLRVLATGELRSLGRNGVRMVDVRVLSATHRNIQASDGFRADLFARLAGWTIQAPPLRHHRDDILCLARAEIDRHRPELEIATSAAEALLLWGWPRNVRELETTIAAAVVRAGESRVLRCEHLPAPLAAPLEPRRSAAPSAPPLELLVSRATQPTADELRLVLDRLDGNVLRVAEYFGKDRKQIYRWLERAAIDPDKHRA
jgi:transcriptional regulator with GAF, ATPase, and Fis domain